MPQSMSPLMFTTGYRWVHASTIVVRTINARTHGPTPTNICGVGVLFHPSGTIDGYDTRVMAMQKQAADREVTTDLTRMNTFLKAEIVKGLTLNADFTYAIQNMNSGSQDNSVYGINWSGKPVPSYIVTKGNSGIWRDFSKQNTWTANAYVNYTKTFAKKHNLNVMAGVNAEEEEYKYLYGTRNVMYDQEGYPELNMAWQGWTRFELESYIPRFCRLFRPYQL